MALSIKSLSTVEGIRKGIKSVCTRAASLQGDIQRVAVATLAHTAQHGDWTLSVELIDGLSKANGVRKSALTNWFENFMGATVEKDTSGNTVFIYDVGNNHETIKLELAQAVNWYEFKKDPVDNTKTFEELAAAFIINAAKSVKTGKVSHEELELAKTFFKAVKDSEGDLTVEAEIAELSQAA